MLTALFCLIGMRYVFVIVVFFGKWIVLNLLTFILAVWSVLLLLTGASFHLWGFRGKTKWGKGEKTIGLSITRYLGLIYS